MAILPKMHYIVDLESLLFIAWCFPFFHPPQKKTTTTLLLLTHGASVSSLLRRCFFSEDPTMGLPILPLTCEPRTEIVKRGTVSGAVIREDFSR